MSVVRYFNWIQEYKVIGINNNTYINYKKRNITQLSAYNNKQYYVRLFKLIC